MGKHNVEALYQTLAKIFSEKEDCKVTVTVKQNEK
jgi:hypothetical protein